MLFCIDSFGERCRNSVYDCRCGGYWCNGSGCGCYGGGCLAVIAQHEVDNFSGPGGGSSCAYIGIAYGVGGGEAPVDVAIAQEGEPVVDGGGIGWIDGIAIKGGGITGIPAYAARIAIRQTHSCGPIVCLGPPDGEGEGVVYIGVAGGLLDDDSSSYHWTAHARKDLVDGRSWQRRRSDYITCIGSAAHSVPC